VPIVKAKHRARHLDNKTVSQFLERISRMTVKYTLSNIPYTLDDIKLGSLVPNKARPNQDAFGPTQNLNLKIDFTWRNQKNFSFLQNLKQEGFLRLQVAKLFSFSGDGSNSTNKELWSREGRIYELTQPKKLFRQLCQSEEAKRWLIQIHDEGEDIHFVVGYRTFFDATEADETSKLSRLEGKLNVPAGELASSGARMAIGGDSPDIEISGGHSSKLYEGESFEIPGERIFAICFRKVLFNWFLPKDVDSVHLGKENYWVVTSVKRGDTGDGEMMVEVDLDDNEDDPGNGAIVETETELEEYYIPDDGEGLAVEFNEDV
jgi:hypothetical protein